MPRKCNNCGSNYVRTVQVHNQCLLDEDDLDNPHINTEADYNGTIDWDGEFSRDELVCSECNTIQ